MTGRVTIDADLNFVQGLIPHGGLTSKNAISVPPALLHVHLPPTRLLSHERDAMGTKGDEG
ncbi:MAG: hypothetical protein Ct9H300mP28_32650 [Pseudomonadota bacterium]|nr:MAG: hypothetical protein Ct9H300mP28_32650 [Pseudomonadota bacterium]